MRIRFGSRGTRCALLMATAVVGAGSLAGQGIADAGARVGWVGLTGDEFAAAKDAVGFEAFLRWSFPSGIGIQGGAHYSSHELEGTSDNLGLLSVYLEPRYLFPVSLGVRGAAPYVGLRALYARFENVTGEADVNADGWGIGGVGGLLIPITPRLGLEVSGWYSGLTSGTAKFNDTQVPNSGRSGGLFAVQVALFASTGR